MNRTIVVCSSNRPVQETTMACLQNLTRAGAELVWQKGSADVAFARNMALSHALRVAVTRNKSAEAPPQSSFARQYDPDGCPEPPTAIDTLLMVDDDMAFSLEQAQALVDHARETGVGASAMYATMLGTLAATRLETLSERQRWLVGLGLVALPLTAVQEVAKRSERFKSHGQDIVEFCWTAALNGAWFAEDYTLCRRLGGVHLLPIGVGHLKVIPVYPDENTIELIRQNKRLPNEDELSMLQRVDEPAMLEALRKKQ